MGVVIMQGVPKIFGALRGHLCDSIAFLLPLPSTLSRERSCATVKVQH